MRAPRKAAVAALIALTLAGPLAAQTKPPLKPAEIDKLDLNAVVLTMRDDCAVMKRAFAELVRRHPEISQTAADCGLGGEAAGFDPAPLSDDALAARIEALSAELDALVARGEALQAAGATLDPEVAALLKTPEASPPPPAPATPAKPAPAEEASAKAVPASTKAYCKDLYAKAYSLCGTLGDRSCKFRAADDWSICEKTGRWP